LHKVIKDAQYIEFNFGGDGDDDDDYDVLSTRTMKRGYDAPVT